MNFFFFDTLGVCIYYVDASRRYEYSVSIFHFSFLIFSRLFFPFCIASPIVGLDLFSSLEVISTLNMSLAAFTDSRDEF